MGRWLDGRQRALIAWLVHAVLVDQMGIGWDSAVGWRGLTPGAGRTCGPTVPWLLIGCGSDRLGVRRGMRLGRCMGEMTEARDSGIHSAEEVHSWLVLSFLSLSVYSSYNSTFSIELATLPSTLHLKKEQESNCKIKFKHFLCYRIKYRNCCHDILYDFHYLFIYLFICLISLFNVFLLFYSRVS